MEAGHIKAQAVIEPLGFHAAFCAPRRLRIEMQRGIIGRMGLGQARGPTAGLVTLGEGDVEQQVIRRPVLQAYGRRKAFEIQGPFTGRVITVGFRRAGELPEGRPKSCQRGEGPLAIRTGNKTGGRGRETTGRLVVEAIAVRLEAFKFFMLDAEAAAGGHGPLVRDMDIQVGVDGLGLGRQVIGAIDHQ